MPPRCTICTHPERRAIDRDLTEGAPFPDIAARHCVSAHALGRHHRAGHVLATVAKAQAAAEVADGDSLLAKVEELAENARRIGRAAEDEGDKRTALMAIKELVRIVELLGKLSGLVSANGTVVNVVQAQQTVIRVEYPDDDRPDGTVDFR